MLPEDLILDQFVIVLVYVQLPRAVLQFVDAPLNLAKVSLGVVLENADSFQHICDLNLFEKLIEAAFEHAVLRAVLAEAATAIWNESLYVESERAENSPVNILILRNTLFFVLLLSILHCFGPNHSVLQNILALAVRASFKIDPEKR